MGKSSKATGKTKKDDVADTKTEQKLQAVLLADSFLNSFRPLSLDRAKMLCPLNNVTLLDYAMDFLAGSGVEELFVICTSDAVEQHVHSHTWSAGTMNVVVHKDASVTNAGDALRELDKKNVVQSDPFILMFGDVVTNVDILEAMKAHKERHEKDSAAIMTLLLQSVGGSDTSYAAIRSSQDDLLIGLDPQQDNRVVCYDNHASQGAVSVPCSFWTQHSQIDLYTDLVDAGIYICSPDVLARFSDEFDYRSIDKEFLANSVAEEEEGLQNRIHAHLLKPGEYAARVHNFPSYHAISQDLLQRWCYPVVPDNLPSGYEKKFRYQLQTRQKYHYRETKEPPKVERSSTVQGPGMMGSHCRVGPDCEITGCVIGHHVDIAANVTLTGCHLWDGVKVEEGATVIQSILSHDVIIQKGARIHRGCVIGKGCIIGEGVVVPEFTRITNAKEVHGDDEDGFGDFDDESSEDEKSKEEEPQEQELVVSDSHVVGPNGVGHTWAPVPDYNSDRDDDEDDEEQDKLQTQSMGYDLTAVYERRKEQQKEEDDGLSEADSEHDMEDQAFSAFTDGAFTFDAAAAVPSAQPVVFGRQKGVDVVKELKDICMEFEETSPIENLSIELNSYKFSQNASYSDCTMAATLAILERMEITESMSDGKLVGALKARLEIWAPLLQKMGIGQDEQKSVIFALEKAAMDGSVVGNKLSTGNSLRFLLQTLHGEECLSEEAILSWAAERKDEPADSPQGKLFQLQSIKDFLEWLEEESEDDDSEGDDEDSEGS